MNCFYRCRLFCSSCLSGSSDVRNIVQTTLGTLATRTRRRRRSTCFNTLKFHRTSRSLLRQVFKNVRKSTKINQKLCFWYERTSKSWSSGRKHPEWYHYCKSLNSRGGRNFRGGGHHFSMKIAILQWRIEFFQWKLQFFIEKLQLFNEKLQVVGEKLQFVNKKCVFSWKIAIAHWKNCNFH